MKELVLTIIALGVFTMFYPGIADAGMYGEVYIPKHEFIGFFGLPTLSRFVLTF